MLQRLHDLPVGFGILLTCAAFIAPALLGVFMLQPHIARRFSGEADVNTVLGFVLNAFAVYFGVLLALLSIAVFENRNRAQDSIDREAASLVRLARDLRVYPEPVGADLLGQLSAYVAHEVGPGWARQARGLASPGEVMIVDRLHGALSRFEPSGARETLNHTQALRSFAEFVDHRRMRIAQGAESVPSVMWWVVLAGAVLNIVVVWAFDLRRLSHALVGGALALFIGAVIYMVLVLDQPFRGSNGLKPEALLAAARETGLLP